MLYHVGPPPPSPPASIEKPDDEEPSFSPRMTVPTMSEPLNFVLDEQEQLPPPVILTLARASTESPLQLASRQPRPSTSQPPLPTPMDAAHLQPPSVSKPVRRNTTGSSPLQNQLRTQRSIQKQQNNAPEDTLILGDASTALASDIEIHSEQIRRERQSKRAKQLQQAEAEAALTRTDTRGTRGTRDDDDKPLVGNLIGEDHVNYVLMYNMLTGIRTGVSRCQAKIKRPLTDEDFIARHKYSFDIIGNELTPSAKYDFKFKDYAPWVFRTLREDFFRIDPADYLLSLTSKYILSELGSPGKSGSFFYFSRDYRFIIKTIHHSEHKFILKTLKQYYEHVKGNPHTLLSRFYGLHRVKLPRGKKIHFVIMNNLFPPHRDIHETYDLKGSTVGREYPEEKALKNPRAVLKDLNWVNRKKELELGPEKRALFNEQMRRDVEYLQSVDVMDYSLLVGIHNMRRGNRDNVRRNTLKVFSPEITQVPRTKQSTRGTKTPEAIAMRRGLRSSDPKALSSVSSNATNTVPGISTNVVAPHPIVTAPISTHPFSVSPTPYQTNPPAPPFASTSPPTPTTTVPAPSVTSANNDVMTQFHLNPNQTHEENLTSFLDEDTTRDRQYFLFYQDEGGLQATDEENLPLSVIYYLGVIDILTPYGAVKKAEHWWKSFLAVTEGVDRGKISQIDPRKYGKRFMAFMKASVRGGGGTDSFK